MQCVLLTGEDQVIVLETEVYRALKGEGKR